MSNPSSVEAYSEQKITLTEGASIQAALKTGAFGAINESSATKPWIITGTSNEQVSVISTGSGSDSVSLGTSKDVTINVATGVDYVEVVGDAVNTNIIGGEGRKTIIIGGTLDPSSISMGGSSLSSDSIQITGNVEDSTLVGSAGRDSITIGGDVKGSGSNKSVIDTRDGNDFVVLDGTNATGAGNVDAASIDLGAGRDSLSIVGAVKDSTIVAGADADEVSIGGPVSNATIDLGTGKDTLTIAGALKDATISAGADADVVSLGGGASYAQIDLGAGNDTISIGGTAAYTDASLKGGDGKDVFVFDATSYNGSVTITDYNVVEDVIVGNVASSSVSVAASGAVSLGTAGVVNVSKTGEFYAVQYAATPGGTTEYHAWGDEDGSTINIEGWNKASQIDGMINGEAADLIVGGKKNDSIDLGANDSVYGGAGNDDITIFANKTQEYVGLASAGGRDTVNGFTKYNDSVAGVAVSDDEADVLYLFENNIADLKLEAVAGGLNAKLGSTASVQLNMAPVTNDAEINIKDNSGKTYEVDFVNGTATTSNYTDEFADIYYAGSNTAALNFANVDSALVVDLANRSLDVNGNSLANTDGVTYYGKFASVTGGKDATVLLGAADVKETLTAGAGDTTLWGGGKKADLLDRGSSTDNSVVFFFGNGDGADTVKGSKWGNSDTSDVLWLGSTSLKGIKNDGTSATTISLTDGSKLTMSGQTDANNVVKFTMDGQNVQQAKIGVTGKSNTWTYDENVNIYIGGKKNTLSVTNSVDDANVWLDGSTGKAYDGVTTIDASSNSGTVILAGGAANETIKAGVGTSSVWGGGAGNDVLVGNNVGNTTFYFGNGNGSDVITASNSDDKVVLYNTAITDVKAIDDSKSNTLKITLNDGSSLTVNNSNSGVNTFQLADGSTWKRDSSTGAWSQA